MGLERRSSSKWWYGSYMVNGQRLCENLEVEIKGRVPEGRRDHGDQTFQLSKGEALAELKRRIAEASTKKHAVAHLEKLYEIQTGDKRASILLEKMEAEWDSLESLKQVRRPRSSRYVEQSHSTMKKFVAFLGASYPRAKTMAEVTPAMVEAWLKSLDPGKLAARTFGDKLILMRSVFKRLGVKAGIMRSPFDGFESEGSVGMIHRQPFTKQELGKWVDAAPAVLRPVLIAGVCTAMREGDCCLLKWTSINLKEGFVVVKTNKTGETAEIPIFPMLRHELESASQAGDYVWPEAAEMYRHNRSGVTYRLKKALKTAGIVSTVKRETTERLASVKDFHSLRVTWITEALKAGIPMELVRRVTGHATTDVVLKHYFRPGRDDFRRTLNSALPKALTGGKSISREDLVAKVLRQAKEDNWKEKVREALKLLKVGRQKAA